MKKTSAGIKALIGLLTVLIVAAAAVLVFLFLAPGLVNASEEEQGAAEESGEKLVASENLTMGTSFPLDDLSYQIQGTEPPTTEAPTTAARTTRATTEAATTAATTEETTEWNTEPDVESEYILPESNTRYYTRTELERLTDEELYYARNEIYARLGRKFSKAELQDYFNSKSWYVPVYEPAAFDRMGESVFNEYEKANLNLIISIEGSR